MAPDVLTAALLLFAAAGLIGFVSPGFIESVNEDGVRRWPMALSAALLAAVSVLCRILGEVSAALICSATSSSCVSKRVSLASF